MIFNVAAMFFPVFVWIMMIVFMISEKKGTKRTSEEFRKDRIDVKKHFYMYEIEKENGTKAMLSRPGG